MKRKLRNYLINRKMQLRLTIRFLLLTLFFAAMMGILVYQTIWPVVSGFVPYALINQLKEEIFFRLFYFSIPLVLILTASCIIFTHRIAGPLYNLESKLTKLLEGEYPGLVKLRKGDELQELAEKLNELIVLLKNSEPNDLPWYTSGKNVSKDKQ